MKLVTYERNGKVSIGILVGGQLVDILAGLDLIGAGSSLPSECDMKALLARKQGLEAVGQLRAEVRGGWDRLREAVQPFNQVRLRAPLLNPNKIVCIGLNYCDYAQESQQPLPKEPIIFGKYANSIIGPGEDILLSTGLTTMVDYEAELAVIIGKRAADVAEKEALGYVAGYTIFNDVSARDLQMRDGQWMKGKCLDTFAPLGPWLVTADEIPDPGNLDIKLWLNGEIMQSSNTGKMVFGVANLVSFLSKFMTLEPGDLIATGTPAGVGFTRRPPVYLVPGDVVEIEIEGLGILKNGVAKKRIGKTG